MSAVNDTYASCHLRHPMPGCTLVEISGELDAFSAPQVEQQIVSQLPRECGKLVLDLADVAFIDSTGVRLLIHLLRYAPPNDPLVVIYPRARCARNALDIVGIGRVARLVDSLEEV